MQPNHIPFLLPLDDVQERAKQIVQQLGGQPTRAPQAQNDDTVIGYKGRFFADDAQPVVKSGKHDGAYLFFRRVIADIWDYPLVQTTMAGSRGVTEVDRLQSRVSKERLDEAAEQLERLQQVLKEMGLIKAVAPLKEGSQVNRITSLRVFGAHLRTEPKGVYNLAIGEMVEYTEDRSFLALYELLGRVLETLRFWGILLEYDFASITSSLDKDKRFVCAPSPTL